MGPKPEIPAEVINAQTRAADPGISAWVSANAGSGKTHVLASRVIRLLLDGSDPQKILCLTYTKAAAANMSHRIFDTLGRWAMADDEGLSIAINELTGTMPSDERLRAARRLFARALETPGGLKIQTIHAFCEAILHQFPLEANIAGHFEMLDGRMESILVAEARRILLTGAAGQDEDLSNAFATVLSVAGETGLDRLMQEIIARRDDLTLWLEEEGGAEACRQDLLLVFGMEAGATPASIAGNILPDSYFTQERFSALGIEATNAGLKQTGQFAGKGLSALAEDAPEAILRALIPLFTREEKGAMIVRSSRGMPGKALEPLFPQASEEFERAAQVFLKAGEQLATLDLVNNTTAALQIADHLIERYEALKRSRGFLDFNDLIRRTANLLARPDAAAWVHYKLDRGIDHILVDEAQDTSPVQWEVIRKLAGEFFAGQGARDNVTRTVFAVGDEKQSIYSFQGAEPDAFDQSLQHFRQSAKNAGQPFEPVRLDYSFRSTSDVLGAVDSVFSNASVRAGLSRFGYMDHRAIRAGQPGHVEVWPSIGATETEDEEDWTKGIDHATLPAVELAEKIADTVRHWIDTGEVLPGRQGRRISAGDILVLVRKRDRFIHALSRALKNRDIPVAGADRLSLPAHIAIRDMIAIGRFVLQPEDDLSLACVLKSPVFGLDDDDLMKLSMDRPASRSLWSMLRKAARSEPRYHACETLLLAWRAEIGFLKPADFFATLLARDGLRRRMVARLGAEADEILDEFLSFALAQEKAGVAEMESLLHTLEATGPEIKRELDQNRRDLRIMTAHSAKGLEAPVVFLVDSGSAPVSVQLRPVLTPFTSPNDQRKRFIWRAGAKKTSALSAIDDDNDRKAEEEYRRLLYVGMTRAEDRLIVCGYHGKKEQKDGTWQRLVHDGLAGSPESRQVTHPVSGETILLYRQNPEIDETGKPAQEPSATIEPAIELPFDPATRPVRIDPLPRPLSPSGAALLVEPDVQDAPPSGSPVLEHSDMPSFAIRRGLAIHTLFQMLPGLPRESRESTARRWLEKTASDWPLGEIDKAAKSVHAILDDVHFAEVFAEGSRAEVPVSGQVEIAGHAHPVSGVIDRLAVLPDRVVVLDFKTNRPPPRDLSDVPHAYSVQMALYRELLRPLYPDRPVECLLLFTEAARLIALPHEAMDEAMTRLRKRRDEVVT